MISKCLRHEAKGAHARGIPSMGAEGGKTAARKRAGEERSASAWKAVLARWAKAREKAQQSAAGALRWWLLPTARLVTAAAVSYRVRAVSRRRDKLSDFSGERVWRGPRGPWHQGNPHSEILALDK